MGDKSTQRFSARVEARLSLELIETIFQEISQRQNTDEFPELCPFIAHPTQAINSWVLTVSQVPARFFQEVIANQPLKETCNVGRDICTRV